MTRRELRLRAAGLVLLYLTTAVVMGVGLFALVQLFVGSFRWIPLPAAGGDGRPPAERQAGSR